MTKKAMKFKVNSPEHSKQIQEKLFEMGYEWFSSDGKELRYTDREVLYAGSNSYITGSDLIHFDKIHENEEHWLVNNEFVDASYWTQPATSYTQQRNQKYENTVKNIKESAKESNEYKETPAPFISRTVHNKARMLALAEQISSLLHAKQEVPVEYALELYELTVDVAEELKYAEMGGYF